MYTTQMDAARQHIITEEMKAVAAYEQMEEAEVCRLVAAGQVAVSYTHLDVYKRQIQKCVGCMHANMQLIWYGSVTSSCSQ